MGYWENAVSDVQKINPLIAQAEKKPQDPKALKRCATAIDKATDLFTWAKKHLTPGTFQPYKEAWQAVFRANKSGAPPEEMYPIIERYRDAVQKALDSTAPESFRYAGFQISNPDRFEDVLVSKTLHGLDYLAALFKRRGVSNLLKEGVARVNVVLDAGDAAATFHAGTREMTLSVPEMTKGSRPGFDDYAGETVLHEFGHYVHRVYITGEAAAAWDDPWKGLSKGDPRLDHLEIVSDYGKFDKYEDFAETFRVFMAAPDKLTPTAKFRMQRALSLTGLYGKPVIRLASHSAVASAVLVAQRFLSASEAMVLRPDGWGTTGDEAEDYLRRAKKPGHVYRGMTNQEFSATIGKRGPIQSTGAYSHQSEGTNFTDDPREAESYANTGRDDPRKTGKSNYIVEVPVLGSMKRWRDGYFKTPDPVPYDEITRLWRMYPKGEEVWIERVK